MLHFIVNPSSRSNKGRKMWHTIERQLKELHREYKVFFTENLRDGTKFASEICQQKGEKIIVAVGGDGTVNEVINGITDFEHVKFAFLPTGSGNDFAKNLRITTSLSKGLEDILYSKEVREIDVGRAIYETNEKKFSISTGFGFDAAICEQALSNKFKDVLNFLHIGNLVYGLISAKTILLYKPTPMEITIDDKETIHLPKCYFVVVMNLKSEGGGINLCPDAEPDDDYLDVCVVGDMPRLKFLCILPLAYFGLHTTFKNIDMFRCKKIKMVSPIPLPVHTDGETHQHSKEVTACINQQKLKVIAPKNFKK